MAIRATTVLVKPYADVDYVGGSAADVRYLNASAVDFEIVFLMTTNYSDITTLTDSISIARTHGGALGNMVLGTTTLN